MLTLCRIFLPSSLLPLLTSSRHIFPATKEDLKHKGTFLFYSCQVAVYPHLSPCRPDRGQDLTEDLMLVIPTT